ADAERRAAEARAEADRLRAAGPSSSSSNAGRSESDIRRDTTL
ncbi:MAG: Sec-independent protein translocase TatA, partial [Dermatophilaceae bacterium]|nr:Sec-independent protein translocase TatA [Dermatophilaceae bacterium]